MGKPTKYKQCLLSRLIINPGMAKVLSEVSWVPTAFAKVGKAVTIDGYQGTWTVISVYNDIIRTREQLDIERGVQKDVADVLEPHQ